MNSKILFKGKFSKNEIVSKYNKVSLRCVDPVIENKAKQIWQNKVREARIAGKKIWDQPVYRLDDFFVDKNKCGLKFSTIPFSIRISIKDFTDELFYKGEKYLPMAVYSSIFVETSDGKFIFGEKSDKYATNRKYSYIGGVFNKSLEYDDEVDPFAASCNEVIEELGIDTKDIESFFLLGALRTESCNVALVFYCKLKLIKDEVIKKFRNRKDLELSDLFFAKAKELKDVGVNKIGKEPEIVDFYELYE